MARIRKNVEDTTTSAKAINRGVSWALNMSCPLIEAIAINLYSGLFGVMLKSKSFGGMFIGILWFILLVKMSKYNTYKKMRENTGTATYQIILTSVPKKEINFLFAILLLYTKSKVFVVKTKLFYVKHKINYVDDEN